MRERVAKWAQWITRYVLDGLLEDHRFHRIIRHIVLSVHAEQEHQRSKEILDTFFEYCTAMHVTPKIDKGKLVFDNPNNLDDHLKKVLILYRKEIKAHVERMDDMARREQQSQENRQRPA